MAKGPVIPEKLERWPVDRLVPYERNARTHSPEQVAQIAASIAEFGFTNPILVASDAGIIAGHGRLEAAKQLGLAEVPVVVLDHLSDAQRRAYVLADNQLALNAGWDADILRVELQELEAQEFDLSLLGFSEDELSELLPEIEQLEAEEQGDPDEVPEAPEDPITKPGDLWILGNHRLLCGDSTNIQHVERLMDGKKADMVFTDPPYNIGFGGTMSNTSKNGKLVPHVGMNAKHREIHNDKKSPEEFQDFIRSVLSVIQLNCSGAYYISFGSGNFHELLTPVASSIGYKSIIIWVKNQSPMGGGAYRRRYEPIIYGNFSGDFYGTPYSEDDVWEFDRTNKNDLHPTMKPVDLVANALSHGSKPGGSVLDLFMGSGTTIIAAEKTRRSAYGMELDPAYCDVIVKRWQAFTGKTATLESTGEPFPADDE